MGRRGTRGLMACPYAAADQVVSADGAKPVSSGRGRAAALRRAGNGRDLLLVKRKTPATPKSGNGGRSFLAPTRKSTRSALKDFLRPHPSRLSRSFAPSALRMT